MSLCVVCNRRVVATVGHGGLWLPVPLPMLYSAGFDRPCGISIRAIHSSYVEFLGRADDFEQSEGRG